MVGSMAERESAELWMLATEELHRGAASGLWVPPGGGKHPHGALYMPL